jgi:hypothetical protein
MSKPYNSRKDSVGTNRSIDAIPGIFEAVQPKIPGQADKNLEIWPILP